MTRNIWLEKHSKHILREHFLREHFLREHFLREHFLREHFLMKHLRIEAVFNEDLSGFSIIKI